MKLKIRAHHGSCEYDVVLPLFQISCWDEQTSALKEPKSVFSCSETLTNLLIPRTRLMPRLRLAFHNGANCRNRDYCSLHNTSTALYIRRNQNAPQQRRCTGFDIVASGLAGGSCNFHARLRLVLTFALFFFLYSFIFPLCIVISFYFLSTFFSTFIY